MYCSGKGAVWPDTSCLSFVPTQDNLPPQADEAGYLFWGRAMDDGLTREDLLLSFSESPENKASIMGAISSGIWLNDHLA